MKRILLAGLSALVFLCPAKVAFSQSRSLSWQEIEDAGSDHLMTVTAPPGYSAEDVLRTILENPKLPDRIRAPFVRLALAKAPRLLEDLHSQ